MSFLLSIGAIGIAVILGYWLFLRLGTGTADATYDAVGFFSSIIWILAGVFLILGGHTLLGAALIAIWSYVGISKGKATEDRVRAKIGG